MYFYISKIEQFIWSEPLVIILMLTHILFTIKLKFPQKYTLKGLKYIFKGYGNDSKVKDKGISSFKSLMTILAATLGTGNIIGISVAISIGGIGSIFWIFISGIFAIATKYAETYLVLKYRQEDTKGYYGGTMYVLRDMLNLKVLAVLFSIFTIFASLGIGCMIQSNAITSSITNSSYVNKYIIAFFTTVFCAYIIFGNEKRISNINSIIVPIATIIYLSLCIYILYIFRFNIGLSVLKIVKEALSFRSLTGGILGSIAIKAMNVGMSKGLFSNEAGMGSSPIFNATVKENNIKNESIIASTSVFIDTVLLCSITGVTLVSSGMCNVTNDPIKLICKVFSFVPYGNILLTFSIGIFALATIPCWQYYGSVAVKFLSKNNNTVNKIYKYIYIACIFFGGIFTLNIVWQISSIANALMVIPNLIMIYILLNKIT